MVNIEGLTKVYKEKIEKLMETTTFCQACDYPLGTHGECINCNQKQEEERVSAIQRQHLDIERLGGIRPYTSFTEETFDSRCYDAQKVLEVAKAAQNLYIWGPSGTGKSHLATILIRRTETGLTIKPQDLMRELKKNAFDSAKEQEAVRRFISHPCLHIEDLGTEKLTPHTSSILYEIIDGKWNNMKSGLIITSNYSLDELAKHLEHDRIASRIAGMCKIIRLTGEDRRVTKEKE